MVKRTRRDLSNPTIKKIIKEQTNYTPTRSHGNHRGHPSRGGLGRGWWILLAILVIAGLAAFLKFNPAILDSVSELITIESAFQADETTVGNSSDQPAADQQAAEPTVQPQAEKPPQQESQPPATPVARRIQVEVLNGCGVKGLAEKFTRYLRKANIDVVSRGNYTHFEVEKSRILDRIDNPERVKQVAEIIGISPEQISVRRDPNLQLDATIIIGADYRRLKPFKDSN